MFYRDNKAMVAASGNILPSVLEEKSIPDPLDSPNCFNDENTINFDEDKRYDINLSSCTSEENAADPLTINTDDSISDMRENSTNNGKADIFFVALQLLTFVKFIQILDIRYE